MKNFARNFFVGNLILNQYVATKGRKKPFEFRCLPISQNLCILIRASRDLETSLGLVSVSSRNRDETKTRPSLELSRRDETKPSRLQESLGLEGTWIKIFFIWNSNFKEQKYKNYLNLTSRPLNYFFVTAGVSRNCKPKGDFLKLRLRSHVTKNFVCNTGIWCKTPVRIKWPSCGLRPPSSFLSAHVFYFKLPCCINNY